MLYTPHDYQAAGIADITTCLRAGVDGLWTSPTGSGKSTIHAGVLETLPDAWCIVPSIEIALGIHRALGLPPLHEAPDKAQRTGTESARIFTDKRALIALKAGAVPPKFLIYDEAHHGTDETHKSIEALCGHVPKAGLTATPYRGTPYGTQELRDLFGGRITPILTEEASIRRGVTVLPEFSTLPLLDDELIDVAGGEFVIRAVDSALRSRLEQLIEYIMQQWDGSQWRLPSTVVLPSADLCVEVAQQLTDRGAKAEVVLAGTRGRQGIFQRTLARESILIQMRVVGEGVDLPLRWMLDVSPTMSPVLWFQRVGRIRRPGGTSYYISACHNLLRHAYLFEGLIPPAAVRQARAAWGADWKPSRRMMARALGFTGFGKFLPCEVPLASGDTILFYALKSGLDSYVILLPFGASKPTYLHRADVYTGETQSFVKNGFIIEYPAKRKGKWTKIEKLPDIQGAASYPNDSLSPGAAKFWNSSAKYYGLDHDFKPTAKEYLILPVLKQSGVKL